MRGLAEGGSETKGSGLHLAKRGRDEIDSFYVRGLAEGGNEIK